MVIRDNKNDVVCYPCKKTVSEFGLAQAHLFGHIRDIQKLSDNTYEIYTELFLSEPNYYKPTRRSKLLINGTNGYRTHFNSTEPFCKVTIHDFEKVIKQCEEDRVLPYQTRVSDEDLDYQIKITKECIEYLQKH